MLYCPKCGAQNAVTQNFCGNCATPLHSQQVMAPNYTTVPPAYITAPPKKKKRKWLFILVGAIILLFIIWLFWEPEYEVEDYGDTFAPSNTQGNNPQPLPQVESSQFSNALNNILGNDSFTSFGSDYGDNYSNDDHYDYNDAYGDVSGWTENDWNEFWEMVYESFDEDVIEYLEQLSFEDLIDLIVEIILSE